MLAVAGLVGLPDNIDDVIALELQLIARVQAGNADRLVPQHTDDAGLGGLDELERHGDSGGAGAEAFRDPLAEPDGGEGGLETVASTLSTRTLRMWGTQLFVGWSGQEVFAASRHCCRDVTNVDIPLLFG
jgi:hypothetical protein